MTGHLRDWTFKGGGGSLGGFLTDPEAPESQKPILEFDSDGEIIDVKEVINLRYVTRFIFDNLFLWINLIIIVNMVAGIKKYKYLKTLINYFFKE